MLANMASSLLVHKRIKTTLAKAKALRMYVEPLITKTKGLSTVGEKTHAQRVVFSYLKNKEAVKAYDKAANLNPKYKKKEQLLPGLSFENPYQVMIVPDVYRIMKEKYPSYKMISQKLVYHKDSKYDIMSLTNREGENISLYFKYFIDQMPRPLEGSIKLPDESEFEDGNAGGEMDNLSIRELVERVRKQVQSTKKQKDL